MAPISPLLQRLERYYDAVPRRRVRVEEVGPFTLFVAASGWPFYARPTLGASLFAAADVQRVLARQRELDVTQAIEWVDEVTPGLVDIVEAAGVSVERCPLMVLDGAPRGSAGTVRLVDVDSLDDLVASRAAISVAFAHGGTATGDAGVDARDESLTSTYAQVDDTLRARLTSGEHRVAAVWVAGSPELGPVGGGSYAALAGVAEIAGVGVLPAYRRRGLAAQLTYALAADARARDVETVFCSAQSDDVASVYRGVGFVRVATACIASAS